MVPEESFDTAMVSPQTTVISTTIGAAGAVKQGSNQVALIAAMDAAPTVGYNVVKKYGRTADAEADFGVGSDIAKGVSAARRSGAPIVYAIAVSPLTGGPFTESFGTSSVLNTGTLNSARLPITSITTATVDGVAKVVKYTHLTPSGQSVASTDVLFNTKTGAFKAGTSTSGSGAGIVVVYKSHDWNTALGKLDLNPYEYHVPPGKTFNAQNYGIFDKLLTHATDENKLIAGGLDSGVLESDVDALVTAVRTGRIFLLAGYYDSGEDVTSGTAGALCAQPVNGTMKMVKAPAGVSWNDSYTRSAFGDEESPVSGTWHYVGVNAVYKDLGGSFRISNDRACTALTDSERFHSTRRSVRLTEVNIDDALTTARAASSAAIPYTQEGIYLVRSIIQSQVVDLIGKGVLASGIITVPDIADVDATDKTNRVLNSVEVSVTLASQIHEFKLQLNAKV